MLVLIGCAGAVADKVACSPDIIMAKLPDKCGKYDMEYGTISTKGFLVRFKDQVEVHLSGELTLEDIVGRKVVLAGKYWPQYIGGLLREDGTSSGSYIIGNLEKAELVQVYTDKGLDKCKLFRWCKSVKLKNKPK
jgi:hypothetical protein